MTVSSTENRKEYAGNGATTSFATSPVVFFVDADLTLYVVNDTTGAVTDLVLDTDYTVSGGDGSTGTVDLSAGSDPYGAPATGTTLVIVRELAITQAADFVNNDSSDAEVAEDALDRLTMIAQQLDARIDRSFALADSDISSASTVIPTPAASKLIGWNSAGTALQNYAATDFDTALTTAFTLTLLDDLTDDAFITTLLSGADTDAMFQQIVANATAETAPAVGDLIMLSDVSLTPDNGRKMTLENFLKVVNGLTEDLAPVKTTDYLLSYDASASAAKKVLMQEFPLPRSYLAGGTLANNTTDATNDIDIAAGVARDSTDVANIRWSALTKRLDAAWAAGTNQGGLDTGTIADTTYHVFAIRKDSDGTGDILFSASATAPTMPTGYTYFRRIGSILRESAAIVSFSQNGDEFLLKAAVNDVSTTTLGTTAVLADLSVPSGVKVNALVAAQASNGAGGIFVYITSPDQNNEAASASAGRASLATEAASANFGAGHFNVRTNTSGQIRYVGNASSTTFELATFGWIDRRGGDD